MCGLIGYVGNEPCVQFILDGLTRLEYRGYDSAGLACINGQDGRLCVHKEVGGVALIKKLQDTIQFNGTIGVGHTRWATHGVVDYANAHPHLNCEKNIAVVHNGIIEGHELIRDQLEKAGHVLISTTDSEIAAHLFSSLVRELHDEKAALIALAGRLDGAYAFVFISEHQPDCLYVIRRRSPLVIGKGAQEVFIASDYLAFADKTNNVFFLPDECCAILRKDGALVYTFMGESIDVIYQQIDTRYAQVDKHGFEHYMLKEIYEQKRAIGRTLSFFNLIGSECCDFTNVPLSRASDHSDCIWRQIGLSKDFIKDLKAINIVAAGTSWHAGRIAQFFFECIAKIPTHVYLASEFRYMPFFPDPQTAFIMISQSGETADTLEAMRLVNSFEIPTIALTNVSSSSIVREAQGFLPMQAGPEISVASTKAFSTQLASLYWLANRIAYERGLISRAAVNTAQEDLLVVAEILEAAIETYKMKITSELAGFYAQFDRFIFLGRHVSYPFALEAALKLKEISYIFSQCYPAGELKHGPIALIDHRTPVVLFSVIDDLIYRKLVSNAHEVKARNGHLIVFAFEGQNELINLADCVFIFPKVPALLAPLAMTGLMQFFVYEITRVLGCPIDKPRNLAKSVTVE